MSGLSKKLRSSRCPYTAAVVVAGGSGARFGGDKLMAELVGIPVLARSILAMERSSLVSELIVAARPDLVDTVKELCQRYNVQKPVIVVPGGRTRLLSSCAGAAAASDQAGIIAIHDGARPLVSERVIDDAVWGAYRHLAAAPAVPVTDTIRRAEEHYAVETPDRSSLFAMQTPQCFQAQLIRAALTDAVKNAPELTDDAAAAERIGARLYLTAGDRENIKITTPLDLALAEMLLRSRDPKIERRTIDDVGVNRA